MNILELDSFKLSDAVKFHNRLNPRLWGPDEHLLPEVRNKLMEIAADFQEFLGVSDLDVQDITLSGSNAAYSYTPHSDIDLHLVVNVPQDEIYQELFNAKKYQYNDMHDIRIHGADVELYVQPADQPAVSLGEYSVKNNDWIEVPKRKRARIDQTLVRHKYEDVKARIESALKENDSDRVESLIRKIKEMRQAGLDAHGEFGPENLAFKMLRKQGWIEKLYNHRAATRDRELSLKEQPKKPVTYGFKTATDDYKSLFKPAAPKAPATNTDIQFNRPQDYEWYMRQQAQKKKIAAEDAGETWDGVNPTTCMFLNEDDDQEQIVHEFIEWAADKLGITEMPEIFIHSDPKWSVDEHSFGRYEPDSHILHVNMANRHLFDILRTTAHELAHCKQNQVSPLPDNAGETGSEYENEAHAAAGIIMRDFADAHPELFATPTLKEASGYIPTKKQAKDPRFSMALTVDVKPGQTGKEANKMSLDTDSQGQPAMIYRSVNQVSESKKAKSRFGYEPLTQEPGGIEDDLGNQEATGPEFPPKFPEGTTKIDVSDVYDWYKIGQQISDMDDIDPEDIGQGPPQTVIVFPSDEAEQAYLKQFKRLGLKTHDIDAGKEHYHEDIMQELAAEFALLEDEYLGEIKMSPSNLRAEAAKTGAQAGMEFEMIVPNVNVETEPEYEPDMDQDTRSRDFDDIRSFFYDGDYNSRRDVDQLMQSLQEQFDEWGEEQIMEAWADEGQDYMREYIETNDYWDDTEAREEATNALQAEYGDSLDPEEFQTMLEQLVKEKFDEFVQQQWDDQDQYHDEALDQYRDEQRGEQSEREWLNDTYPYMSDVQANFDIQWPYYYDINEGDGEMDIDNVANDFSEAIGKPINASSSYHGARREAGHYVVEPDGSLDPDDSDDGGLEFVSPPMPIDELLADLNKVKAWADSRGCYTNNSTGLHINVSVPDYSLEKLDYIKLALLMGDQYVLDQFGRAGNTYTKAAIGKIRDKIKQQPERAQEFLEKMRNGMGQLASKAIHSGTTDKYTSINTKSGYIEFRSPGGDWLDANFDKIENTLLRFTVALSAAINPEAYRQEYLKKLYKLLEVKGTEDPLSYFARYAAGEMPKAELKSFIKQTQLQRRIEKDPTGGQQYWWEVSRPGYFASIQVVASSKEEAIDKAIEPGNYPDWASARNTLEAKPIKPFDSSPVRASVGEPQPIGQQGNWGIWLTGENRFSRAPGQSDNRVLRRFPSREAAEQWIEQTRATNPGLRSDIEVREIEPQPAGRPTGAMPGDRPSNPEGNWVISPENDRSAVAYRFMAADRDDAALVARQWRQANPGQVWITQRDDNRTLGQPAIPGSTVDLQRQRQAAAQQQQPAPPTGAGRELVGWSVLLPTGEEVTQIHGIGNNQGDANRIAAEWLRQNGMGVSGEGFEVVPLWREA